MTSAIQTKAGELAALLLALPTRTVEQERDQTLALCSAVRILAEACSGDVGGMIDAASDAEHTVERDRELEREAA